MRLSGAVTSWVGDGFTGGGMWWTGGIYARVLMHPRPLWVCFGHGRWTLCRLLASLHCLPACKDLQCLFFLWEVGTVGKVKAFFKVNWFSVLCELVGSEHERIFLEVLHPALCSSRAWRVQGHWPTNAPFCPLQNVYCVPHLRGGLWIVRASFLSWWTAMTKK